MERKRISIIFGSFEAKTLIALRYLVLAQNLVQQSFEFEILPKDPEAPFLKRLDSKNPQDREEIEEEAKQFMDSYEDWLRENASEYELSYDSLDEVVFITKLKFSDYFYLTGEDNWTIFALGYWERSMAPPSIIEFILTLLSDVAISAACRGRSLDSHQATKACVSDFNQNLDEARYKVLVGYLCPVCERLMKECGGVDFVKDARVLLSREWLGSADDPNTPASIAKKLGFDLFQTRGFKPSAREKAIEVLQQDWVKHVLQLVYAVALAALLVWLGLQKIN